MKDAAANAEKKEYVQRVQRHDPLWIKDGELVLPALDHGELTRILITGRVRSGRLTALGAGGKILGVHPDDVGVLAWWGAAYVLHRRQNIPAYKERISRLRALGDEATQLGVEFHAPELIWDDGEDSLLSRKLLCTLLQEFQEVWHRHGGQSAGLGNNVVGEFAGPVVELVEYVLRRAGLADDEMPSRGAMRDAWRRRPSDKGRAIRTGKRVRWKGC